MPSVPTPPPSSSKAGIISTPTGERHIPSSTRADGSKRKEIKIRPGYKPPEDVEVYKNRTAEVFRNIGSGPPPGSEGYGEDDKNGTSGANSEKNKKRREARKKAAATAAPNPEAGAQETTSNTAIKVPELPLDPEAEKEKKARNLKKKLKQAKELKEKKEGGAALLPEQFAKVIKIQELIRELDAMGFDAEGEPKDKISE